MRNLFAGPRVSKIEAALAKWFDSDLFQGGLLPSACGGELNDKQCYQLFASHEASLGTEMAWLIDMAEGKDESEGYQLFVRMNQELPDLFDRYGGDVIDEALRYFVAAALRHLRLAPLAMKQVCIFSGSSGCTR